MARVGAPHGRGGALPGDEERPCVEAPEIVRRGSDLRRESIPEDEEAAWPDSDDERDPGGADLRRRGTAHHTRGEFHRRRDSHEQVFDMSAATSDHRFDAPPLARPRRRSSTELSDHSDVSDFALSEGGRSMGVARRDSARDVSDAGSDAGDELASSQNLDMTVPNKRRLSHSLPELKLMDKVQQFLQDNPPVPAAAPADEHPGNRRRKIDLSRTEYRRRSSGNLSLHDDAHDVLADDASEGPATARSDAPSELGSPVDPARSRRQRKNYDLDRDEFRRRSSAQLSLHDDDLDDLADPADEPPRARTPARLVAALPPALPPADRPRRHSHSASPASSPTAKHPRPSPFAGSPRLSKKKRRFREDGYDLDLTYVTPRLVAMGFPAAEREAMYRNDGAELERLFEERHGSGRYRLYNLCAERSYGPDRFGGAFCRFPFQDHAPPPLGMFFFFCADVDDFLQADAGAVAAVHCKAGKGRTGVMLSAYLLWSGQWDDADDAMRFYGFARTENVKGVTIPSQRRFVRYFRALLDRRAPLSLPARSSDASASPRTPAPPLDGASDDGDASETDDDAAAPRSSREPHGARGLVRRRDAPARLRLAGPEAPRVAARAPDDAAPPKVNGEAAFDAARAALASLEAHPERFLVAGRAPRHLVDPAWNAENRRQARGHRGHLPPPVVLAVAEVNLRNVRPNDLLGRHYEPCFTIACRDFEYRSADLLKAAGGARSRSTGGGPYARGKADFSFWFHTAFVDGGVLTLGKADLDKACKDGAHRRFRADFGVELRFAPVEPTLSRILFPLGSKPPRVTRVVG
ncbi:phosphatase [Aureococcus anophagefferens]|nr:phosphatase [Aureococcus anophagefferens]